jgi:hypothetical protein
MWFVRKDDKREPPSPERVYEIVLEFERLVQVNDNEGFRRFGMEHFEDLPETDREAFLLAIYNDMREKGLQAEAEQWVYDRLDSFSKNVQDNIEDEVWGTIIDAYANKGVWRTGRKDRPSERTNSRRRKTQAVAISPASPATDALPALDLKPNIFGVGVNLNYILGWFKSRRSK